MKAQMIYVLFLFAISNTFAQQNLVEEQIDALIFAAKRNNIIAVNELVYKPENIKYTLKKVLLLTGDSNFMIRNQAYIIAKKAGNVSQNKKEVENAVEIMSKGCLDINMGVALYCSKALQAFKRESFTNEAKLNIANALKPKSRLVQNIAMLVGYLNLTESKMLLLAIANDQGENKKNKWYANLALARMGEKASIESCLQIYKLQGVNNEVVEYMIPDLLYTRQKVFYDEIIKILYLNTKDCLSANPTNEKPILCGFLVMEQLAPYIINYPLSKDASGQIQTDDYNKSLEELKKWFTKNDVNYKISDDSF